MRRATLRCLLLLTGIALLIQTSRAQGDPNFEAGFKAYQVYDGGDIDNINLSNGQLSVDIPLISYPQVGGKLRLEFGLHYVNGGDVGTPSCNEEDACPIFSSGSLQHGFAFVIKGVPAISEALDNNLPEDLCLVNLSMQMPEGAVHQMAPLNRTQWESVDGSGFQASFADSPCGSGNFTITDPNGIQYGGMPFPGAGSSSINYSVTGQLDQNGESVGLSWFTSQAFPTIIHDPNGNNISPNLVYVIANPDFPQYGFYELTGWTDSASRIIPAPVAGDVSKCPSGPVTPTVAISWAPPGLGGGTYPILFCFVPVSETDPIGQDNSYGFPIPYTYNTIDLQSVVLPNGTSWTFQYSSPSLDTNNDLTEITFPTGGTLQYTWGGNSGFFTSSSYCADTFAAYDYLALRNVLTRKLDPISGMAGTWSYDYSNLSSNLTMKVIDPEKNYVMHQFSALASCSPYETEAQYYQSTDGIHGTLLKTVDTSYNFVPSPDTFSFGPVALGVVPYTMKTTWPNLQQSETVFTYDPGTTLHTDYIGYSTGLYGQAFTSTYGRLTSEAEYDYGSGAAPGALIRTTATTYKAFQDSGYLTSNLLNLASSVAIWDANSILQSNTQNGYDEPNGSPQCVCGNQTSVGRWVNTDGSYSTTHYVYNTNGMRTSMTDPNANPPTMYFYDSTGTFLDHIQYPTPSSGVPQIEHFNYDSNTGLLNWFEDRNNQTTHHYYTNMLWPSQIVYPDGGQTTYTYDTPTTFHINQLIDTNLGYTKTSSGEVDGLGRAIRTAVTNGETMPYDQVDTCYDADGRIAFKSYPYQGNGLTANAPCPPMANVPGDTFVYDGLNRVSSVTHSDGSVISTSYLGTCADSAPPFSSYVITQVTDEQLKTRQSCTDGAGRLSAVIENPGGLNFITIYGYDVFNDLVGVVQGNSRPRTFVYDSLSRLTSAANPETGTTPTQYTYDANGNMVTKTDGRGVVSNYSPSDSPIDALNRVTEITYTGGTTPTPTDHFYYDQASVWSLTVTNPVGRLTSEGTYSGSNWIAMAAFSYDPMGRRSFEDHFVNGLYKTTDYTYNLLGSVKSLTYPSGTVLNYSPSGSPFNAGNRPTAAIDTANSINYVTNVHYAATGIPCSMMLGSSITSTWTFNSRWRPQQIQATTSGAPSPCATPTQTGNILDMTYNFNPGSDNGNVMSIANNRDSSRSQYFNYDSLNRVYSAHTGAASGNNAWGELYTIDEWANLTNISALSGYPQPESLNIGSLITGSNQFPTSLGYMYDLVGNMTHDGSHQYVFDAKSQIVQVDSGSTASYVYDVDGRRVQKINGTIYWYGTDGEVLDESDSGGNITNEYIFFNGKRVARRGN